MFQLQIEQCQPNEIERLSDALEDTGALSITLTDQYDDPILEPAPGEAPLWPNVVVNALYQEEEEANVAATNVAGIFSHLHCSIHNLPDQDWERTCLDQFKPQQFGQRLWVCPSWLTPPDPEAVNLILDPGLAFGTGSHATTSLCLAWLDQADLKHKQMIDYGCGSGILALAALKLGAHHVFAVDIDEQALLATKDNAINNAMTPSQLTVDQPGTLNKPVDVLIANILLAPLLALKSRFRALLNNQGVLVVSGLLAEQVPSLIEAYQTEFAHVSTAVEGDWALVVFAAAGA